MSGPPGHIAPHDVRRGPDRDRDPAGAPLAQVGSDLETGVTHPASREHIEPGERVRIAVLPSVPQLAGVRLKSRPVRHIWRTSVTCRDHDRPRRDPLARRGVNHPPDAVTVLRLRRCYPLHLGAPADLQLMPGPIAFQVVDHGVPGRPATRLTGNSEARQPGKAAHGMQVQPVVARPPAGPDLLAAFQHHRVQPPTAQFSGGGQPARAAADDVHLPRLVHAHDPIRLSSSAPTGRCPIFPDARGHTCAGQQSGPSRWLSRNPPEKIPAGHRCRDSAKTWSPRRLVVIQRARMPSSAARAGPFSSSSGAPGRSAERDR